MASKRYTAEQIVGRLHRPEFLPSDGTTVRDAIRSIGVGDKARCRCRKE